MAAYYRRDPWAKKSTKALRTISKVGNAIAKAHAQAQREQKRAAREAERRAAAYNRLLIQNERARIRQIKQTEMAIRRAERERAKAEREREKALKLQQKLQEQRLFEEEAHEIQKDNMLWPNVHKFIEEMVTLQDVNDTIAKCDYEQVNDVEDGYFEKPKPSMQTAKQKAEQEADRKYNLGSAQQDLTTAEKCLQNHVFVDNEPTKDEVAEILMEEAKESIKSFFPWKKKKLRNEYVESNLDVRFTNLHDSWQSRKDSYDARRSKFLSLVSEKESALDNLKKERSNFISVRMKELYDAELKEWRKERDDFYTSFKQNFKKREFDIRNQNKLN